MSNIISLGQCNIKFTVSGSSSTDRCLLNVSVRQMSQKQSISAGEMYLTICQWAGDHFWFYYDVNTLCAIKNETLLFFLITQTNIDRFS